MASNSKRTRGLAGQAQAASKFSLMKHSTTRTGWWGPRKRSDTAQPRSASLMKTQCPVEEMRWFQGSPCPKGPHLRTSVCKSSPSFFQFSFVMTQTLDTSYIELKCGTKLYAMCFGNKQATCKFVRTFPGNHQPQDEPILDLRVAVGDTSYGFPTDAHVEKFRRLTYEEARIACLKHRMETGNGYYLLGGCIA